MPGSWIDTFTTDYVASGRYTVSTGADGTTFSIGGGELLTGLPPGYDQANVSFFDATYPPWHQSAGLTAFCATLDLDVLGSSWTTLSQDSSIAPEMGLVGYGAFGGLAINSQSCLLLPIGDGTWTFRVVTSVPGGSAIPGVLTDSSPLTLSGALQMRLSIIGDGTGAAVQTAILSSSSGALTLTQVVPAAVLAELTVPMSPYLTLNGNVFGAAIGAQLRATLWQYSTCLMPGTIDSVLGPQGVRRRGRIVG